MLTLFILSQLAWNFQQVSFNLIFYLLFLSQLLTGNVTRLQMRQFLFLNIILILINVHQIVLLHIHGAKIALFFIILLLQTAITVFVWSESVKMRLKYKDLFRFYK